MGDKQLQLFPLSTETQPPSPHDTLSTGCYGAVGTACHLRQPTTAVQHLHLTTLCLPAVMMQ